MNSERKIKQDIENALKKFDSQPIRDAATRLLDILGYRSKRISNDALDNEKYDNLFESAFETSNPFKKLCLEKWQNYSRIMQITDEEINQQQTPERQFLFESTNINENLRTSYMFVAVELEGDAFTRTQLADITRFICREAPYSIMVVFRYSDYLSLAIINRRHHKRDKTKQVLEKVTLIKDINLNKPNRAHIEIIYDLYLRNLIQTKEVKNFDMLHDEWEKILNTEELNKKFYRKLFAWYEWAVETATFPTDENRVLKSEEHVIRLITRLLFIWFIKEKGLVADELFDKAQIRNLLVEDDCDNGDSYYRAVLQNLFFATLNTERGERRFSKNNNSDHRNPSVYRYKTQMHNPNRLLELFDQTPFINGGLFDCLDSFKATDEGGYRIDCFSDKQYHKLSIPNRLFFDVQQGLIPLLEHQKFTVEENTPIEQEVALDPELLGRVFENLLAAINPETGETARKQTGSYYTPRAIVDYMVEETLIAILSERCQPTDGNEISWDERLRYLFDYAQMFDDAHEWFDDRETDAIVTTISELKILDPAVGSGAFPMGMLQKLTLALRRLDPDNTRWETLQKGFAGKRAAAAFHTQSQQERDDELTEISQTFERYRDSDFGRKLYLIQNSIFGVDIQSVACQIAKLRFFISLAIEQEPEQDAENLGIKPLPNLETRFIAANTLIGLKRQQTFMSDEVRDLERQLRDNRERHFHATTRQQKRACKNRDKTLRSELAEELERAGMPADDAEKIANWDLYDQNATANWFDLEWMFGLTDGFDVVIGNPPYTDSEMMTKTQPELREIYKTIYQSAKGNWDLFIVFIERGIQLQKENGVISYIVPNTLIGAAYSKALRKILLNYSILGIRDYSTVDVFKESDVYPLVFVMRKSGQKQSVSMIVMDDFDKLSISNQVSAELFYRDIFWDRFFVPENQLQVIVKCLSFPVIDPFFQIGAAATVSEAYTLKEYIQEYSDELSEKPFKKLINTGTVDRYQSLWHKKPIKYIKDSYYVPIVLDSDLRQFSERRFSQAQSRKIIIGGMNKILECVFDEGEYIAGKSTTIVLESGGMDLKYALALLNSKLVSFWFRICYRSLALAGRYLRIGPNEIKTIPIPEVTLEQQTPVIELVDKILAAKAADSDTDTSDLENELDELVYGLYGLTDGEKAIVEGSV